MTNEEYEKMAVEAALAEAEGALSTLDGQISYYEKHLLALQERRREIINRYNLNKLCEHDWLEVTNIQDGSKHYFCHDCGAHKDFDDDNSH